MPAPDEILKLVERLDRNIDAYKAVEYKEARLRTEFVDPMFKALGWDMNNDQGYAEAYKDVVHEDSIRIGAAAEAPDYCFRVGGARKFFLEAKKPAVHIKSAIHPAYQLRRYAWSSDLPLGILTDFEEFAVYDCRVKPSKDDPASTARVLYLTYTDYPSKWDDIAAIFSRDAVLKGSFDKFADGVKGKRGTTRVDDSFLAEIEKWRDSLARNIASRNPSIDARELNFAVQKTIDRVVFLRICEDRGIEPYGKLMALLNGANTYNRLKEHFISADARYNSGLFHFRQEKGINEEPDRLTPGLSIDDKPLKDILASLYYPECPFEFSVLPADILGQVYERFLGKVIRLTAGHQAKVEEKPEVKKAGGVFYTPAYIVRYIVENTVGRLLASRRLDSTAPLRVADISCGSGSFLIVAYQAILDWHLARYAEGNTDRLAKGKAPRVRQGRRGEWKLTIAERKRILVEHIYGVDIDAQAVEVTKLSLLLKVLEGESEEVAHDTLFHERVLPDLADNIKCGNSIASSDFYANRQEALFDTEEMLRVNVFDWERQFPQVFRDGGFDIVLGNPPYVRQETLGEAFKSYAASHYKTYAGTADLFTYFIEKGVGLLRPGGLFSYIVANKWMRANYGRPLRAWLKAQALEEVTDFGDLPVFEGAAAYPCILRIAKEVAQASRLRVQFNTAGETPALPNQFNAAGETPALPNQFNAAGETPALPNQFQAANIATLEFPSLAEHVAAAAFPMARLELDDDGWTLADGHRTALLSKLRKAGVPLADYVKGEIYRGVLTGLNEAFVIDQKTRDRLVAEDPGSAEIIKPFLAGRDIKRYQTVENDEYLILFPKGWTNLNKGRGKSWDCVCGKYPAIAKHLKVFEGKAKTRSDQGNYWWELRECKYYDAFEKPKIIYPNILSKPEFVFNDNFLYANAKCYIIPRDDKFLLGVLNSSVTLFYFKMTLPKLRGGFFEPRYVFFKDFPIPRQPKNDRVTPLVERMLDLQRKLSSERVPAVATALRRQIGATDCELDQAVYRLYGLDAADIQIIDAG